MPNWFRGNFSLTREMDPLDPQHQRHSILVPRASAPRVTRWRLGKQGEYWWRAFFQKEAGRMFAGIQACPTGFTAISVWPRACEATSTSKLASAFLAIFLTFFCPWPKRKHSGLGAISSRPRTCLSALFFIQNIDLRRVLSEWSWYGFLYLNEYVFLWSHCFVGAFSIAAHFLFVKQ